MSPDFQTKRINYSMVMRQSGVMWKSADYADGVLANYAKHSLFIVIVQDYL